MEHAETPTGLVAKRVRKLRAQRGWSAQQLADAMTGVGVEWNRGVVTKLETGRREAVSVAEWLALAYALNVSPLTLLTPEHHLQKVTVTPTLVLDGEDLGRWIAGRQPERPGVPPFDEVDGTPFDWQRELPEWRLAEVMEERKAFAQQAFERLTAFSAEVDRRIQAGELPPDARTWRVRPGWRLLNREGETVEVTVPDGPSPQAGEG